ncbi:MAG: hypothetical protein IJL41_01550 [Clostridia bacterium]|nr:hypothetical protein [Clostridia bacterium]
MSRIKRIGLICAALGVICALVGMAVLKGPDPAAETKTFAVSEVEVIFCDAAYELNYGGGEIKIEFEHTFDGVYEAGLQGRQLTVLCRPDLPWYRSLFSFAFGNGAKLRITLPEDCEGRIRIIGSDGVIHASQPENSDN